MLSIWIKKILSKIFKGRIIPVFSPQLKGISLKVDPLMPGNLFWNNVEEAVHHVYDIFIKKGFIVFDIGANVGLHSYYIARRFENTSIYAFEPFSENADYLKEMVLINKFKNITVVEKAVGKTSGKIYFNKSINNHQGYISEENIGPQVNMTSLDDFFVLNNVKPDFIKIDVEGAEADVLNGFKKNIALLYPIILIELHGFEQAKEVAFFFNKVNYTLCKLAVAEKNSSIKPLILIDNNKETIWPPLNMNGQIVAIPTFKIISFSSFISGL